MGRTELLKRSPQCYKIRDLNVSIKAISENKSPSDVISCFYGGRYDKKAYNEMIKILSEKCGELCRDQSILSYLPIDYPKFFKSNSLKKAFKFAKIGIESDKHLLFVGKEEIGLTQLSKWISYYFSKKKILFVYAPKTAVSDLLGRYIPTLQINKKEI